MRITAVTKQKNGSYDIYVDGERVERLDALVLASFRRIKVGEEITEQELEEIKKTSGLSFAFDAAVRFLARNMRTESEIRSRLEDKGYSQEDTDGAIEKLRSYGYLNDRAYARAYVNTYGKDRGKLRLAYELGSKGIDKSIIDEVLPESEVENAKILADKKAKKYPEKEKMIRYLMSRGFDYDTARIAANEALGEISEI